MSRVSIILSLVLGIGASCMAHNRLVIRALPTKVGRQMRRTSTARLALQSNANSESSTLSDRK